MQKTKFVLNGFSSDDNSIELDSFEYGAENFDGAIEIAQFILRAIKNATGAELTGGYILTHEWPKDLTSNCVSWCLGKPDFTNFQPTM